MQIKTPKDLGAFVRDQRRRQGMDQQTLATKIGVSRQWVIEVEKGKTRAEVGLVFRALSALGVSLSISEVPPSKKGITGQKENTVSDIDIDIDQIIDAARGRIDDD